MFCEGLVVVVGGPMLRGSTKERRGLLNLLKLLKCLRVGHRWKNSRRKAGFRTCERCGLRSKY